MLCWLTKQFFHDFSYIIFLKEGGCVVLAQRMDGGAGPPIFKSQLDHLCMRTTYLNPSKASVSSSAMKDNKHTELVKLIYKKHTEQCLALNKCLISVYYYCFESSVRL